LSFKEGTIIDASIISAPTSTKNQENKRDLEMHQIKKSNAWHFGIKMHIGVDDALGVIHSLETTAANARDITRATRLLNGKESWVWGDVGYLGIEKRDEAKHVETDWFISERLGKRKNLTGAAARLEKIKASVRAKVEHPFRIIKQQFGYNKVCYRGLAKNTTRLYLLAGFANLIRCKEYLLA
jgi:IS5 family transposase